MSPPGTTAIHFLQKKSCDTCREGPSLQAAENINSVSLEYYIYVFLKSHMQIFNITKYKL